MRILGQWRIIDGGKVRDVNLISTEGVVDVYCQNYWYNSLLFTLGLSLFDIFRAVGERKLTWAKAYVKSRLSYERLYREMINFF